MSNIFKSMTVHIEARNMMQLINILKTTVTAVYFNWCCKKGFFLASYRVHIEDKNMTSRQ